MNTVLATLIAREVMNAVRKIMESHSARLAQLDELELKLPEIIQQCADNSNNSVQANDKTKGDTRSSSQV